MSGRIAQLEASHHFLGDQLGTLTRKFEEFASSVHRDLQALGNQRTPWGVLAAWATVILAIAGLAAGPFLQGAIFGYLAGRE